MALAASTASAPAGSSEGHVPAFAEAGGSRLGAAARGAPTPDGRRPPPAWLPLPAVLAALLAGVWLLAGPRTPDLAAATYRAVLFSHAGFALWDTHWYGGHPLPAYSLISPALGALLGVRLTGALAALASVLLFERLLACAGERRERERARRAAAVACFAVAAVADLWSGRLAFALGVTCALACGLALARRRPFVAATMSVLCAAASPAAAALLGLAVLTVALQRRSVRILLAAVVPAAALVLALAALFAEGGFEPFPLRSFLASTAVAVAFLAALPARERLLRLGAVVYLAASVLCLLVHTPIGSNLERYPALLAAPLLVYALLGERPRSRGRASRRPVQALAVAGIAVFVLWGPVRETRAVAGSAATRASYYVPLERFLASVPGGPARVEVPLTRSHWEAALLAPKVPLARGWDKQLEERYDRVLLAPRLQPAVYRAWLAREAVAFVALPDAPLDPSSAAEGRLIRRGLPYLREVFRSAHWRVFAVAGYPGVLSGPGTLEVLSYDGFQIGARAPGRFLVRLRYSSWWALTAGEGCVGAAPGGFTEVVLRRAGPARVAARFSWRGVLGHRGRCR